MRLDDLHLVGRHLVARAPVEEPDLGRAEPQGGAGAVDRGVAAADHEHAAVDVDLLVQAEVLQELDAGQDPDGVLVLHPHLGGVPRADPEEDGVVAVLLAGPRW